MLVCANCNHEQEPGKFCEACGHPMDTYQTSNSSNQSGNNIQQGGAANQQQASATTESVQSNGQQVEAVKETLNNYWSYFINLLKNPTRAFALNENQFVNGLITIGLYIVLFSLGLYFYANSVGNMFGGSVPFTITFRLIFLKIIVLAIAFFAAFAMVKISKHPDSFKTSLTQFGSLLVPFTLLYVLGLIGGIIGSLFLTFAPILISLIFSIAFIPILFVYEKASQVNQQGQNIYLSLATALIMVVAFYIFGEAMISNMIGEFQDRMNPFF